MKKRRPNLLLKVLDDRRLDLEDFDIQIEAARESARRGFTATARAELRGAMCVLNTMDRRTGRLVTS